MKDMDPPNGVSFSIQNEKSAINYLKLLGLLKNFESCPFCNKKNTISLIRRNKYKCKACRKEWSIRKGSPFENLRISLSKIALVSILFSNKLSKPEISKKIKLSYTTVDKIIKILQNVAYNE